MKPIAKVLNGRSFAVLDKFDIDPCLEVTNLNGVARWIEKRFNLVVKDLVVSVTGPMTGSDKDIPYCQDLRWPEQNAAVRQNELKVNRWHRDSCSAAVNGTVSRYIILWSSEVCTELMAFNDEGAAELVKPFKPGSVVLVDNIRCLHRTPPVYDPTIHTNRWFARWISYESDIIPSHMR